MLGWERKEKEEVGCSLRDIVSPCCYQDLIVLIFYIFDVLI
jgi:hypothetical protein